MQAILQYAQQEATEKVAEEELISLVEYIHVFIRNDIQEVLSQKDKQAIADKIPLIALGLGKNMSPSRHAKWLKIVLALSEDGFRAVILPSVVRLLKSTAASPELKAFVEAGANVTQVQLDNLRQVIRVVHAPFKAFKLHKPDNNLEKLFPELQAVLLSISKALL